MQKGPKYMALLTSHLGPEATTNVPPNGEKTFTKCQRVNNAIQGGEFKNVKTAPVATILALSTQAAQAGMDV